MASEIHIHVCHPGEVTKDDLRWLFSHTLDSKYGPPHDLGDKKAFRQWQRDYDFVYMPDEGVEDDENRRKRLTHQEVVKRVFSTPRFCLSDNLNDDHIQQIENIFAEELQLIDEQLIIKIMNTNNSALTDANLVFFLRRHEGKKAFIV